MQPAAGSPRSDTETVCTLMVLCRGKQAHGAPFWAYLCMKPSQAELFYHARRKGRLDLDDYGTLLEWGEGENPPPDVRRRMRDQFGMRDDYEEMLLKLIKQQGGKV